MEKLLGHVSERVKLLVRMGAKAVLLWLLVLPWPALAAISLVANSNSATAIADSNVITVTTPSAVLAGDVMLVVIAQRSASLPLASNIVSVPASWSLVLSSDDASAQGLLVYRKLATAAEPASYSWTLGDSGRMAAGIVAFRGVDTASPVNISGSQSNLSSATYTAPSILTTTASTMLVAFYSALNGNGSVNQSTGMTQAFTAGTGAGSNGLVIGSSYATQASAGASGTKLSTLNTPLANLGALVALKPSAAISPDHYELSLPSSSLACLATTVTVTACSNSSSPCTSPATTLSGATATLTTTGATLGAGTVTFNASGVATTTLSYPAASNGATVSVTLSGESTVATNARMCCPNGSSCAAANSCASTFNTAGFIFASGTGGASASLPTQTAGAGSGTFYLRAVQTSTSTRACEAALTGSTSVNWAAQCNNPGTCSTGNRMTLTGSGASLIAANPAAGVTATTSVPMTFDANGNAPFSFNYGDVGQVTLSVAKAASGTLLTNLAGTSNAFVVKPGGFIVSGIKCTSYAAGACATAAIGSPGNNPAAGSASGTAFIQAGQAFSASVTAVDAGGNTTPNYGREATPESVRLTHALVQPAGGSVGLLANSGLFGGFSAGVATGTAFSWSEVGVITLTPSVGDGSYLGVGDVTGTASSNVGRFIPDHFDTVVTQACPAGAFSYSGQPFSVRVTAMNGLASPTTTTNYGGTTFAKAVTLTDSNAVAGGALSGTGVAIAAFASGIATSAVPTFTFTSAATAPASVTLRASDTDGVSSLRLVAASSVEGATSVRSGRLRLQNAYGSERLALRMPLDLQYWNNGWQLNSADSCTSIAANQFAWTFPTGTAARPNNLAACESALAVAGTAPVFTVTLSAPGIGNTGWADLALNLGVGATGSACTSVNAGTGFSGAASTAGTPWLQRNWSGTVGNPSGRATFGVFKSPIIYGRENY